MNSTAKTVLFWLVIAVSAFLLWQIVRTSSGDRNLREISYSRFLSQVGDGQIARVYIAGDVVQAFDAKGGHFRVVLPRDQSEALRVLEEHGVEIWLRETGAQQSWPTWILNLLPLILLAALWFFMIRQMQTANRRMLARHEQSNSPSSPDSSSRFGP